MRTIVYIDGFNLYYRLLRTSPECKWLNLKDLSNRLLPQNDVISINYYTARVSGRLDKEAPSRQQIYLNALATVPGIQVHFGKFLVSKKWSGIVCPPETRPPVVFQQPFPAVVRTWKTEEKGSDVNLGSHLVRDAFQSKYEVAAVISNDTDLVEPIRIVTQELGLPVGLLSPVDKPADSLRQVASFLRHVKKNDLAACQFPNQIAGTQLKRPVCWQNLEFASPIDSDSESVLL